MRDSSAALPAQTALAYPVELTLQGFLGPACRLEVEVDVAAQSAIARTDTEVSSLFFPGDGSLHVGESHSLVAPEQTSRRFGCWMNLEYSDFSPSG